jgi:3',5'-cyclic AMP phosphodiesterase CpdA
MQLTDVHLGGGFLSRKEDKMTINAIAAMVAAEKPDLIIVTGDVSFAVPYISGTINNAVAHRMFMRLMERLEIPWTIVFGNHDSEAYNYYNRATVSEMYADEALEYCLFIPDGDLSGEGNHVINVKNSAGLITESFYMIDTHSYTDQDPLGIKWDYDYVKQDQIDWYAGKIDAHKAANAAVYATLSDEQKEEYADLLEPKSLMFMHIPLREVKEAYDEYIANGRQDTENVIWKEGFDGETDEVVYSSRTDEELFETILEKGSTKGLFYGHDHLNNFVLEYKGVILSYGYSIDYLAYSDIDTRGYQRGCTVITCAPSGDATIVHENYYQDKYKPLYEKEIVDMEQYKSE